MTAHDHSGHLTQGQSRPLKIALGIVFVIGIAEVAGGIISGSLALISDAGHMMVDMLALGLSIFALAVARRPATPTRTFGYYRVEVMAALANGVTLVVVSLYVFYEAYQRLSDPPPVDTPLMLVIAVIGLVANVVGIMVLRETSHSNLNIRGAFLHVVGDTLSSVGVIVAALIIQFTGLRAADPVVAIFIGLIILWGAVRLVSESSNILLEAAPKDIQLDRVVEAIKKTSGVRDVHDVHIWTITSGIYALSAHLEIEDQKVSEGSEVVREVNESLAHGFSITHTTLQIECQTCDKSCSLPVAAGHEPGEGSPLK